MTACLVFAAAAFAAMAVLGRAPDADVQSALLAAAAAVGLAHGAVDHVRAERLLRRHLARGRTVVFAIGYLGAAAAVLLAWLLAPGVTLVGFLAGSVIHFGMTDAGAEQDASAGWRRWAAVIAHGGAPIVAPCLLRSEETAAVFDVLAGPDGAAAAALFGRPGAAVWLSAVLLVLLAGPKRRAFAAAAEIGAVVALFAAAPPLAGFAIYFGLVHSARVVREEADARGGGRSGFLLFLRQAAPLTLAALTAAGGALWLMTLQPTTVSDAVIRSTFLALSALTAPHMLLAALSSRAAEPTKRTAGA